MAAVPRPLLRKHLELAHELQLAQARVSEIRARLDTIVSAIRLLDPQWVTPKVGKGRLPVPKGRLPRGDAARQSLRALKAFGEAATTPQVVEFIAKAKELTFSSRQDREDFASSVAMALRRYERRGLVVSEPTAGTNRLLWSMRRD